MPDWTKSMERSYEYYIVDPFTWMDSKLLDVVKSSTIDRDSEADTLGSASIEVTDSLDECYVRVYLITIQNGIREKHALGTFLVQTPSLSYDGKTKSNSLDAYTPLIELKEKLPPIGYSALKNDNVMNKAYKIASEQMRAPVIEAKCTTPLYGDFVASTSENWLSFLKEFIANAKYEFALDEMGRVLFAPIQDTASLQPVWTYTDDNSSILYPDISVSRDLYGIPNTVEVIYSGSGGYLYSKVVNDDPNSPVSTVSRGRTIMYRDSNPSFEGEPTQIQLDEYAKRLLKALSSLEYTVSYSHGYCPVRIGDCVRLNYSRLGLNGIKAKVISQSIKCTPECQVSEKAVFTTKLWG